MGFLSVIRRWALRDKMPIREIARRTGLSRNTIKKYLREGAVEPKFKTPKRPSKLDPYTDRLSAWLLIQTRKSRKERRTVKQMHADLVKLDCVPGTGVTLFFGLSSAAITGRRFP
ncbi:helix-turn-helix domain-containing protein, partial [Phaeobacter gallaeciensis]|uniref:helix-turn-helix domain-containing protein n=1 Tax=Phaeobacter gallaeciensis TaxID=60890 RepID=UPI00237F5AF2